MSLILDALKKLEREKQAPDRGFLVVAHVPWATGSPGRGRWIALIAGIAVAAVAAAVFVVVARRSQAPATVAVSPPASTVAPASAVPAGTLPPAAPPAYSGPVPPVPSAMGAPIAPAPAPAVRSRSAKLPTDSPAVPQPPTEGSEGEHTSNAATTPNPQATPATKDDLRLNAISQQDGRPVAVLNDRLVREGDVFDGIRVIRIGEDEVEVEVDGKRRVVRF